MIETWIAVIGSILIILATILGRRYLRKVYRMDEPTQEKQRL